MFAINSYFCLRSHLLTFTDFLFLIKGAKNLALGRVEGEGLGRETWVENPTAINEILINAAVEPAEKNSPRPRDTFPRARSIEDPPENLGNQERILLQPEVKT